MADKDEKYIDSLLKLDLNYEEAQIYFNLLKYGKTGSIVRKLREDLPFIERTTLYSILKRLIEKNCVEEGNSSNESKKLKTFVATDPVEYFIKIYTKKKQELEELVKIKTNILDNLQRIYIRGLELPSEDLDPFIIPYFKPLIEKGWKIKTQKITKGINVLGGEMYFEYHIQPPKNVEKKIEMVGLILSVHDSNIEEDDITLKFIFKQIKKSIKQIHKADFQNIKIVHDEIELFGNQFSSLIIRAREQNTKVKLQFGKTAILPLKNKLFFIWEELIHDQKGYNEFEQENVLKEIVKVILQVEEISIK